MASEKPTRPDLVINLIINTDRRTYHLELRSQEKTYMASVSRAYAQDQLIALGQQNAAADAATQAIALRLGLEGARASQNLRLAVLAALCEILIKSACQ